MRFGISAAGNAVFAHRTKLPTRNLGYGNHPTHCAHVRQLRKSSHDVSDREHARLSGLLCLVHFDESLFKLNFRLLDPDVRCPSRPPNGHQHFFRFFDLGLAVCIGIGHLHAVCSLLYLLHFGAGIYIDAALLEQPRNLLRYFVVLHRNHARQKLKDRDLGPKAAKDRAELHAHSPCANHYQRLGHLVHR